MGVCGGLVGLSLFMRNSLDNFGTVLVLRLVWPHFKSKEISELYRFWHRVYYANGQVYFQVTVSSVRCSESGNRL